MSELMQQLAWVALGGAFGGIARYRLTNVIDRNRHGPFPRGTFVVNTSGALLIGMLMATMTAWMPQAEAGWWLLGVGVLGSFTTVSTFSLQAVTLHTDGQSRTAAYYVLSTVAAAIMMVSAGYFFTSLLIGRAWT